MSFCHLHLLTLLILILSSHPITSGSSGIYGPYQDVRSISLPLVFGNNADVTLRYPVYMQTLRMHVSWIQVGNGPSHAHPQYYWYLHLGTSNCFVVKFRFERFF